MVSMTARSSRFSKFVTLAVIVAFVSAIWLPELLHAQTATDNRDDQIADKFQQIIVLKAEGEYDRAAEQLRQIIEEYADSDRVLRLAYSHLVVVYFENNDEEGARAAAREALERFPDITAEDITLPPFVNGYYDELREEMFGSLTIKEPEGCRVFIDDKHVGETPLVLDYVRAGNHRLTITKSGYEDLAETVTIEAGGALSMKPSLDREHDWKWWSLRVGAGVLVVGLLAIGLSGGDDPKPTEPDEPLPDPPAPPAN